MHRYLKFFSVICFGIGSYAILDALNTRTNEIASTDVNYLNSNINIEINNEILDSSKVNSLYSEKNIEEIYNQSSEENIDRLVVNIKPKPINPSIILQKTKTDNQSLLSFNLESFEFDNFSNKKEEFIKTLLPLISYENQKILIDRENLKNIKTTLLDNKTLKNKDLLYLSKIAKKYNISTKNKYKIDLIDQLLTSVDTIPNSVVLAQAANESGWGTSRFAKEYNAIFGEYTYNFSEGVIPLKREEGKTHLVKSFTSFDKSVESYFKNINTHYAYEEFRLMRKIMRDKNNFTNINLLVGTLDNYAEDNKYVDTINAIIKSNNLTQFDIINYIPSRS